MRSRILLATVFAVLCVMLDTQRNSQIFLEQIDVQIMQAFWVYCGVKENAEDSKYTDHIVPRHAVFPGASFLTMTLVSFLKDLQEKFLLLFDDKLKNKITRFGAQVITERQEVLMKLKWSFCCQVHLSMYFHREGEHALNYVSQKSLLVNEKVIVYVNGV